MVHGWIRKTFLRRIENLINNPVVYKALVVFVREWGNDGKLARYKDRRITTYYGIATSSGTLTLQARLLAHTLLPCNLA